MPPPGSEPPTRATGRPSAAETFAAFAAGLDAEAIPPDVREQALAHLLDTIGCAVAAVGVGEGAAARTVVTAQGGAPQATAFGCPDAVPAAAAAMVNGVAAHSLDFDDTHEASICHVGVVVGPAAIAVAESVGASGSELLAAFVAGSETTCRIGMAAHGAFHARGFHPTSVCGTFGAAVAAGRLLGLDAERIATAMGIAGSFASGLFEYLADGSQTKPLHAGWAAQAGVQAALLSAAGAEGPASVLEGRYGLYASHLGRPVDIEAQLGDLGERWETARIAFKAYPACHFMHGAVAAAAQAAASADGAEIAAVTVRVPQSAVPVVLEPAGDKLAPRTPYDARFSLPYGVAAHLVHGGLDVGSYRAEAIRDPDVLALAGRVGYTTWADGTEPSPFGGEAVLTLADGRRVEASVPFPAGSPENPMTIEAVVGKFRANAGQVVGAADADALAASVLRLADADDVGAVFRRFAAR